MAESINAFLAKNKQSEKTEEVYVTDSFIDEKGNPIFWKIRALTAEEEKLISDSVKIEKKDRKTGTITVLNDDSEYLARMVAQCVVYPDLGDRELQKSYDCKTKVETLRAMLTAGELAKLAQKIIKVSDLDIDENEKSDIEAEIEYAKN